MTLTALLNLPILIVKRTTAVTLDPFGNANRTEANIATVGELQQIRRDEPGDENETSDTRWLLILPAGTDIATGDGIIADGLIYEMVGNPWKARNPRTQIVSHVEATLRRVAGDEDTA